MHRYDCNILKSNAIGRLTKCIYFQSAMVLHLKLLNDIKLRDNYNWLL